MQAFRPVRDLDGEQVPLDEAAWRATRAVAGSVLLQASVLAALLTVMGIALCRSR
ncbi:MAG: hypothetical protein HY319_29145 [Armatimonadetes bacterium]|nr:hypothetical protein [Armatimonadota bacterium]